MQGKESKEPKDIGVRHYVNGRDSWKVGYNHYWLRFRGLLTSLVVTLLFMGVPWWWDSNWKWKPFPNEVCFSPQVASIVLFIIAVILIVALFSYARKRAHRSLDCKDKLHTMSHIMRDAFCDLLARTGARKSKHDLAHEKKYLLNQSDAIAKSIVDYYSILSKTNCLGAVIRLAEDQPDDGKDEAHYVTVGRAGSTNQTRSETSEPIIANEGIPKFFKALPGGTKGILFFHNLDLAKRYAIYKETENEKQFEDDYKCVIAIPLNGYNGRKKDLIGILTITGRSNRKVLKLHHLDLLKAIGDRLAEHYSATLSRLAATKRMPNLYTDKVTLKTN